MEEICLHFGCPNRHPRHHFEISLINEVGRCCYCFLSVLHVRPANQRTIIAVALCQKLLTPMVNRFWWYNLMEKRIWNNLEVDGF